MAKRRLAAFADAYLKYMLQSKLADQQAEAVYSRQEANNRSQDGRQLRQLALSDPTGGIASMTGQDEFVPSLRALSGPIGQKIADTNDLSELYTNEDIRSLVGSRADRSGHDRAGAIASQIGKILPSKRQVSAPTDGTLPSYSLVPTERPEITDLMAQRDAVRGRITTADEYETQVAGSRKFTESREGVLGINSGENMTLPDVLRRQKEDAEADAQNELATLKTTGTARAQQAGRVAESAATGTQRGTINTRFGMLDKLKAIEEALAKARVSGDASKVPPNVLSPFADRLIAISSALNSGAESQFAGRSRGMRLSAANWGVPGMADNGPLIDPATGKAIMAEDGRTPMTRQDGVQQLEAISRGLTATLLRAVGRVGVATDKDEENTRMLFPRMGLTETENINQNTTFKRLVETIEKMGPQFPPIDPNLPIAQQEAETQRRIQQALTVGAGGDPNVNDVSIDELLGGR
jgi:hypothetical protein